MHALHGNTRRGRSESVAAPSGRLGAVERPSTGAWLSAGRRRLPVRELTEPQPADKLRASGWSLPQDLPSDYTFRVYDTRLESGWMTRMLPTLGLETGAEHLVIGGDFLTKPHLEDAAALQTSSPKRWGPLGDQAYHLVVPPRPHTNVWLPRARQQLLLEADGSWITILVVVDRAKCPETWTPSSLLHALPHAAMLLHDPTLEVRVAAMGERPPLVRVPADCQMLPPPHWETSLLAHDRVLVAISLRCHAGQRPSVSVRWVGTSPPPVQQSTLELLRLEYMLPPATRAASGERALRAAVRKVVQLLGAGGTAAPPLRQVQFVNGVASALLGVPTSSARQWLRCSGFEGLYIRPFWTPATSAALARDQFQLVWVKGQLEAGPRLWTALHELPGFFGLLADNKDVAVRMSAGADHAVLKRHIAFVVGDNITLKSTEPGVRWWRLGPLTEAELWRVHDLIAATGLQCVRPELRRARMGPFRWAVFFPARGQPSTTTFDDGSWNSSAAQLTPAEPPPRPRRTIGAALTAHSTWGGARSVPAAPAHVGFTVPAEAHHFPAPATLATPTVQPGAAPATSTSSSRPHAVPPPRPSATLGPGNRSPPRRRRNDRKAGDGSTPASSSDTMAAMVTELTAVRRQLESLQSELRALRTENASLQQQLATARGVHQHQPYAPLMQLPSIDQPRFSYTPPRPACDGHQHPPDLTAQPSAVTAVSPDAVEPKRARHSDLPAGTAHQDTIMTDASPPAPASAGARRALSLGPHEAHGF